MEKMRSSCPEEEEEDILLIMTRRKVDSSSAELSKPLQDSEDSSYDSDCEVSEDGQTHYDVSRTVSDTLGQEFAEYVTTTNPTTGTATTTELFNRELTESGYEQDPGYGSRVEFAKKLGYSESQVRTVLGKLGACPSQNELLSELILLDSSSCSSGGGGGALAVGAAAAEADNTVTTTMMNPVVLLRHVVIDGSNVAMSHGGNKTFSCRGIQLAVDYFRSRGHKEITVFVPSYRKESPKSDEPPVADQETLFELEKQGTLVFTPSRITVNNKRLVCYDDRYVIKLAVDVDGIVVSNDNYRDLALESFEFKRVVAERLLMYSFVNDRFMPPEDPLGRNGPSLTQFLSKTPLLYSAPPCPYGRKCTYGQKCKYYHSTQAKSVSDTLRKQAAMKTQSVPITLSSSSQSSSSTFTMLLTRTKSAVVPMQSNSNNNNNMENSHKKLQRQLSINPQGDPRISRWGGGGSSSSGGSGSGSTTYLNPFPDNPALSQVWGPPLLVQEQQSSLIKVGVGVGDSKASSSSSRTSMYYHLSAIFPEDQVRHVMSLHPEETDPSLICKILVNLFK